jgi:hypothetical protein
MSRTTTTGGRHAHRSGTEFDEGYINSSKFCCTNSVIGTVCFRRRSKPLFHSSAAWFSGVLIGRDTRLKVYVGNGQGKPRFRTISDSLYARARRRPGVTMFWIFEARTLSTQPAKPPGPQSRTVPWGQVQGIPWPRSTARVRLHGFSEVRQ